MRKAIGLAVGVTLVLALASGSVVWAHGGGGGGHGGGGGGGHGGGFGGGHGGFGGGFGGGFHSGGFGGGYSGGMRGFSSPSFGGQSYSGAARSFSSSPLRSLSGPSNMHGLSGLSGRGNLSSSATSFQARHSGGLPNSLATHSLSANKGLTGNSAIHHVSLSNAVSRGNLPQNLHAARSLNHQSNLGRQNGLNNLNNFASHRNNNFNNGAFNNGMNRGAFNHNRNFFFFPFFGFGFPFFGYGYWPYGYGYGYGGYGYGGYGYGGYGYGGYGYPYYGYNAYCGYGGYGAYAAAPATANPSDPTEAEQYAQQGEADFMAGNYTGAMHAWRHAIVDDPNNGVLVMMMAQALFANGSYDEAAGAVQQAMLTLPDDQWGVVVTNYRELYPDIQKYTDQLRALEKAIKEKDDSPAMHFLLGYHYGYLGFPRDAVVQLAKVKELAPNDQMAAKLFDQMSAKIPKPASPVEEPVK